MSAPSYESVGRLAVDVSSLRADVRGLRCEWAEEDGDAYCSLEYPGDQSAWCATCRSRAERAVDLRRLRERFNTAVRRLRRSP